MIRVLQVVSSLEGCGGVQMLLKNYYKYMDRNEIKFDFIVHGENIGELEKYFKDNGSNIFHITPKSESLYKNLKEMNSIIKKGNYDIVHAHQDIMSIFPMYFAKKSKVKMRIAHSHLAIENQKLIRKLVDKVLKRLLKIYSTEWWACGKEAGKCLWGEKAVETGKVYIMNNAIEIEKFKFDLNIRSKIRKELNLCNKFVIGHIGRFTYQKNHELVIEIFNEVYKTNQDAILLLIGTGELEERIKEQVERLKLSNAVVFLGVRSDIENIMQAMDILLLPSRYEGLPVVLVEAQTSGLRSFVSNKITKEIKITDKVEYMNLYDKPKQWANKILSYNRPYERNNDSNMIREYGFDIITQAKELESIYFRRKHQW